MAKRPVEKYDFKAFGEAIKEARKGRKESRKKVSDEMYISPRYLANIENNGQHPSLQIFFELIQLIVSKSTFVYSKVGMAFFSNLKISNCGQKGRIVVASRASWYQLAIFESDFFKSKFKLLVGLCPNPFRSASCRCRPRVCSKHFYNKKDSLGLSHNGRILGCHRLSGLCFFDGVLFFCKEQFYVTLRTKKFLHLVFRFTVIRVGCFLFRQQLGIFCI